MIELRRNSTTKQYVIIITDPTPEEKEFMREVLYGYSGDEKNITYSFAPIHFISKESVEGVEYNGEDPSDLSEMSSYAMYNDDYER